MKNEIRNLIKVNVNKRILVNCIQCSSVEIPIKTKIKKIGKSIDSTSLV